MRYVENIVQRGRPQVTTWRIRIAYWTPKAAHALVIRRYVVLIAFLMVAQKRLNVMLYVHCLSC